MFVSEEGFGSLVRELLFHNNLSDLVKLNVLFFEIRMLNKKSIRKLITIL